MVFVHIKHRNRHTLPDIGKEKKIWLKKNENTIEMELEEIPVLELLNRDFKIIVLNVELRSTVQEDVKLLIYVRL